MQPCQCCQLPVLLCWISSREDFGGTDEAAANWTQLSSYVLPPCKYMYTTKVTYELLPCKYITKVTAHGIVQHCYMLTT